MANQETNFLSVIERVFKSPIDFMGQSVQLVGRVRHVRTLGKRLTFFLLQTPAGGLQCVYQDPRLDVSSESVVKVEGVLCQNDVVREGVIGIELQVLKCEVLSLAEELPFPVGTIPSSRQLRLENRHIDLRNPRVAATFRIRSAFILYTHKFFSRNGFVLVTSPKIVGSWAKGAAELLEINYFDSSAFLSIASILYHGMLISGDLSRVYEVGPAFSTNYSKDAFNLSEFSVVEYACAYFNREDTVRLTQEYILEVVENLIRYNETDFKMLDVDIKSLPTNFDIVTYSEVIDYLVESGLNLAWGETHELPAAAFPLLQRRFRGFFWIFDQPASQKWAFTKCDSLDYAGRRVCRDFQLWHCQRPRLAEGSEREVCYDIIRDEIRSRHLPPEAYHYYLSALQHACPPYSGIGLGVERFLMLLLNEHNIREVVLYPRDPDHFCP